MLPDEPLQRRRPPHLYRNTVTWQGPARAPGHPYTLPYSGPRPVQVLGAALTWLDPDDHRAIELGVSVQAQRDGSLTVRWLRRRGRLRQLLGLGPRDVAGGVDLSRLLLHVGLVIDTAF